MCVCVCVCVCVRQESTPNPRQPTIRVFGENVVERLFHGTKANHNLTFLKHKQDAGVTSEVRKQFPPHSSPQTPTSHTHTHTHTHTSAHRKGDVDGRRARKHGEVAEPKQRIGWDWISLEANAVAVEGWERVHKESSLVGHVAMKGLCADSNFGEAIAGDIPTCMLNR